MALRIPPKLLAVKRCRRRECHDVLALWPLVTNSISSDRKRHYIVFISSIYRQHVLSSTSVMASILSNKKRRDSAGSFTSTCSSFSSRMLCTRFKMQNFSAIACESPPGESESSQAKLLPYPTFRKESLTNSLSSFVMGLFSAL